MPTYELFLFAVIAVLLAGAVIVVTGRNGSDTPSDGDETRSPTNAQTGFAVDPPAPATKLRVTVTAPHAAAPPTARALAAKPVPTPGSIRFEELEVGQTVSVQTETATYILTLRDIHTRQFEAVRDGMTLEGTRTKERFAILFQGSHLPLHGYLYGWMIVGGRLAFYKVKDGQVHQISTSTKILKIFTSIPLRQAS